MSSDQGWISLYRSIRDHWLWQEKRTFSKAEAWIDILLTVQHSTRKKRVMIKGKILECGPGESLKSLATWSTRWSWSRSKVSRFFKQLEKDGQIRTKNESVTERIIVVNWAKYQDMRNGSATNMKRTRNGSETQANTDNNDNNVNNVINNNNKPKKFFSSNYQINLLEKQRDEALKLSPHMSEQIMDHYEKKINEAKGVLNEKN